MYRRRLTPYQKIVRASERGTGVRLSRYEVHSLADDHAIAARADLDDLPPGVEDEMGRVDHRERRLANGWDGEK